MVQGGAVGAYEYHIDLNRLYFFHPFRRQLRVFGHLLVENPSVTQYRGKFHVLYPHLLENYNIIPRSLFGEVCPVVPDEALAERLRP